MFARDDWTLFRSLETLGQRAGVPRERIPDVVVKELVDNALDAAGSCDYGFIDPDDQARGFYIQDDGPGIPGSDEDIAAMFSIGRSLLSSKLLRLPTRGALGNGLRVVAGAAIATEGQLRVATGGRVLQLVPREDGGTTATGVGSYERPGTRVEVRLGDGMPPPNLDLARRAVILAGDGPAYNGKTSPHWYGVDAFFELCRAAGERTVRDLVAELDGCTGSKAGRIASRFPRRLVASLSREEAAQLLDDARWQAREVGPKRLRKVGDLGGKLGAHAFQYGTFEHQGGRGAPVKLPVLVEAWVTRCETALCMAHVNRTPTTALMGSWHEKNSLYIEGCGLDAALDVGKFTPQVLFNITTPYMPITTDGKAPDLGPLRVLIAETVNKAIRKAKRHKARGSTSYGASQPPSQKDAILASLPGAVDKASGGDHHRYSLRQLFYVVRPLVIAAIGQTIDYDWFSKVVAEHEACNGHDLPGIYRDTRGTLYHPHTDETIPLGTLAVEKYRRPAWAFSRILYSEKEGLFPILQDAHWPERFDCALLTSKGFASRAARDVIDLLAGTDEPLTVFAIHDADGYGTKIIEALQEGVQDRGGRPVNIINLGLEPDEGMAMELPVEPAERKRNRAVPVAAYAADWKDWYQDKRIELNAMTSPVLLDWLERRMAEHGATAKLVPPDPVLGERLRGEVRDQLQTRITDRILREAQLDEQVQRAVASVEPVLRREEDGRLAGHVHAALHDDPVLRWSQPVEERAGNIADGVEGVGFKEKKEEEHG